jgi:hypothetical protein
MDSAVNMHLAIIKLQDSLRVAESARAARAVARPSRRRRPAWLATWPRTRATVAPADRAGAEAVPSGPRAAFGA